MFEKLKEMNQELEALKKVHLEKSKAMFTDVAKLLFEKHPKLESFGWNQYTPYFNDGEECTFSARTDEPDINGLDGYEINFGDEQVTDWNSPKVGNEYPKKANPDYNPELHLAHQDVTEFLANMDEAVLRDLFGDHVQVLVTAGGTEVEEYEHD